MRVPTHKTSSGTRPSSLRTLPYNCERCRRDKTKCDKTWPRCRRCVRKGYNCVCVATKRGRPSKASKQSTSAIMSMPNKRKRTLGPNIFMNMQIQTPQLPRDASAGTNNSTTLAPGGLDGMDILHSAASMELLAEQARQASNDQKTFRTGGHLMQQEALANMHQPGAATSVYHPSTMQGHWQAQHLSNNSPYPYLQTNADKTYHAKGVARSILLSNMWVYFRSNDYEGISNGYKVVSTIYSNPPSRRCNFQDRN